MPDEDGIGVRHFQQTLDICSTNDSDEIWSII